MAGNHSSVGINYESQTPLHGPMRPVPVSTMKCTSKLTQCLFAYSHGRF